MLVVEKKGRASETVMMSFLQNEIEIRKTKRSLKMQIFISAAGVQFHSHVRITLCIALER